MKNTITFSQFCDQWPESRKNSFTYEGMRALFDYLEEYENDTGEELEYDPVAIDCDFVEYDTATEAAENYTEFTDDNDEEETEEEKEDRAIEFLRDNTQLIIFNSGVIIQNF